MKIYSKKVVIDGSVMYYLHDTITDKAFSIYNFSVLSDLPCEIAACSSVSVYKEGNILIDELEFHEAYDKALDSLQNYVP